MIKQYLDLVIVMNQLLTGFDAPELNTLYVDHFKRCRAYSSLFENQSCADMREKPWGRIINYRWPAHNEKLMNERRCPVYATKIPPNYPMKSEK